MGVKPRDNETRKRERIKTSNQGVGDNRPFFDSNSYTIFVIWPYIIG
jgi:hypothetical protein